MSSGAPLRAALLTPQGRGAIATVSVSGQGAIEVVAKLFQAVARRTLLVSNRIYYGRWGHEAGEEVVIAARHAGSVEIHCHGGHAAAAAILESLRQLGCAVVDWHDELNGVTSVAAEAQLALTQATTERAVLHLLDQYNGALSAAIEQIRAHVTGGDIGLAQQRLVELSQTAPVGLHLASPWRVVIAGRPNVGKSSLINALLGYERAIVFDQPGTTRDVVSAQTAFDGWPVELSDTAGIRKSTDVIEAAGVSLAQRRLAKADLIVLVFDVSQDWSCEDSQMPEQWPDSLILHNKADLSARMKGRPSGLHVSARSGAGLLELQKQIANRLVPKSPDPGEPILFTQRQVALLEISAAALDAQQTNDALAALDQLDSNRTLSD
jgi:tRNA modification GTPase